MNNVFFELGLFDPKYHFSYPMLNIERFVYLLPEACVLVLSCDSCYIHGHLYEIIRSIPNKSRFNSFAKAKSKLFEIILTEIIVA